MADPDGPKSSGRDLAFRRASPSSTDLEARRARAAIASRMFGAGVAPVVVGRYRIESRIGSGGMGVVYRAHDPELARDVAVKVLHPETARSDAAETARARLIREARAMAQLADPNVISVYDVGTVDEGVFVAMELVHGQNLAEWLERDPRPDWRAILAVLIAAGRGLAAAHTAGVVHRDFKPENVLVGQDGRVRVVDFGLAAGNVPRSTELDPAEPESAASSGEITDTLTRTGAVLGTPMYMSPEQFDGQPATHASDQFSFCVTAYMALWNQPPFSGDSFDAYATSVRLGVVRPSPAGAQVPGWIHGELARGLAVDPTARHRTMGELLDRLATALQPRSRRWQLVAATVASALATTVVVFALSRGEEPRTHGGAPLPSQPPVTAPPEPVAPAPAGVAAVPPAPATSTSPPQPIAPAPAKPDVVPAPARAGPPKYCYWSEDTDAYLTEDGSKRKFLKHADRCYECSHSKRPGFDERQCQGTNMICHDSRNPERCS